jgi:hypothetical protein
MRLRPMTEEEMRRKAERLSTTGKMPSLEQLCEAVLEARKTYTNKIRRARREAREQVVRKSN